MLHSKCSLCSVGLRQSRGVLGSSQFVIDKLRIRSQPLPPAYDVHTLSYNVGKFVDGWRDFEAGIEMRNFGRKYPGDWMMHRTFFYGLLDKTGN